MISDLLNGSQKDFESWNYGQSDVKPTFENCNKNLKQKSNEWWHKGWNEVKQNPPS